MRRLLLLATVSLLAVGIVAADADQFWQESKTPSRHAMATFTPVVQHFRFYADGTESGSSPLGNEDANIIAIIAADTQVHLRVMIQETGGADGATTDDYAVQVSKNAAAYAAIGAASNNVQADTGSTLTDAGATTNRATNGLTNGTGVFVAGQQEEGNGEVTDHQLTASNYTEHVWALKLINADLASGDTLDFRITKNAGSPGMTNSVTPRITIGKAASATGAIALNPVTIAGSGTETMTATGAIAFNPVTVAGVGTETMTATGAIALNAVTTVGAGTETMTGTGAVALPSVTIASAGTETISGMGDITLAAVTFTIDGSHTEAAADLECNIIVRGFGLDAGAAGLVSRGFLCPGTVTATTDTHDGGDAPRKRLHNYQPLPSLAEVRRRLLSRTKRPIDEIEDAAEQIEALAEQIEEPAAPWVNPVPLPERGDAAKTLALLGQEARRIQMVLDHVKSMARQRALDHYRESVRALEAAMRERQEAEEADELVQIVAQIL